MILQVSHLNKSFHEVPVLTDVTFHLEDNDKCAIVGINGAGKTTLLRIILGRLNADSGHHVISRDKSVGYLAQNVEVTSDRTLLDDMMLSRPELLEMEAKIRSMETSMNELSGPELESLMDQYTSLTHTFELEGGYTYKSEVVGVLKGLGFLEVDFDKKIETLSGGEKTRVALSRLLLRKPDLIILDEPTNHLDMNSIRWLETFLKSYKGAVLLVSHDRYFLDRICNKIVELEHTKSTVFTGNYSDYSAKKEILRTMQMNAYFNQQRDLKHQQEVIDKLKSFNREKSIRRAESREKMMDKVEVLDKPVAENSQMKITLTPYLESGKDVLSIENLEIRYGVRTLFEGLCMDIKKGEHVAIIGDNGTGKTTILKAINELIAPQSGAITLGSNVEIGYYDQEHHVLHDEKTLFDEISDDYPYLNNTQIRTTLAAFLFTGDDVYKLVGSLSGGEKGRLSLAKLMLSQSNFLILDEPTNHLDIQSKEILETAINSYTGTVLYVSHDRYFINRTAHRILELENGSLTEYLGNYDYYLEKKQPTEDTVTDKPGPIAAGSSQYLVSPVSSSEGTAGSLDWKAQKEEQARLRKLQNELKKCEERIEQLENRNAELEELMSKPEVATNSVRLQELTNEHTKNNEELSSLYEKWETLSEES